MSVVTEDWKIGWSRRGKASDALTLNAEGGSRGRLGSGQDEAAGEQCKAYGAANIMRLPGRLHITWQDANTLRIDTDAGTQTRLFHFAASRPREPSLQGLSVAQWELRQAEATPGRET